MFCYTHDFFNNWDFNLSKCGVINLSTLVHLREFDILAT